MTSSSEVAREYFLKNRPPPRSTPTQPYDIAVLLDEEAEHAPSNAAAIRKFRRAFRSAGFTPWCIDKTDYGRLAEFDALFIRETTNVHHHTYRFARRAFAEGWSWWMTRNRSCAAPTRCF